MNPNIHFAQGEIIKDAEPVQCTNCKRYHPLNAETYVKFHGMLTIGEVGGLIGPQPIVWCRSGLCGERLMEYLGTFIGFAPTDQRGL